jgi:SAM-dependent methyltransferase
MMQPSLKAESEKLARSWMRHDSGMLRDYLVGGVEDPRLNVQSILTRHFLVRALTGERFGALMEQEYRFTAAMNWLADLVKQVGEADELASVLYALKRGADDAEGIKIPAFILQTFAVLPAAAESLTVPNYIESFLSGTHFAGGQAQPYGSSLETFCRLWRSALELVRAVPSGAPGEAAVEDARATLSVLEPACGSANDYRFLDAYGLARLMNYTGFDLCAKNIENAHALFPDVPFAVGNVFEIAAPDKSFDLCIVHDLFEHLSLEGMQTAVKEVCRVTRQGLCIGFFNMDEVPAHQVRPVEEYHWNLLSMARMKELFAACGFEAQVIHIGTFLRQQVGCKQTHNPNAYTFFLRPA